MQGRGYFSRLRWVPLLAVLALVAAPALGHANQPQGAFAAGMTEVAQTVGDVLKDRTEEQADKAQFRRAIRQVLRALKKADGQSPQSNKHASQAAGKQQPKANAKGASTVEQSANAGADKGQKERKEKKLVREVGKALAAAGVPGGQAGMGKRTRGAANLLARAGGTAAPATGKSGVNGALARILQDLRQTVTAVNNAQKNTLQAKPANQGQAKGNRANGPVNQAQANANPDNAAPNQNQAQAKQGNGKVASKRAQQRIANHVKDLRKDKKDQRLDRKELHKDVRQAKAVAKRTSQKTAAKAGKAGSNAGSHANRGAVANAMQAMLHQAQVHQQTMARAHFAAQARTAGMAAQAHGRRR